jgi:hypothetical protein
MIFFLLVIVVAIVMPRLPSSGQKALIGIAVVPIVLCLFYMIVAPGWVPGSSGRAPRALRMALFAALAAAIVVGAGDFILR